ncbi:MAG TPA: glycosyltransferase family 2 protein [Solirubrobacterales bacterium]|nr:glycosyltransferase family 2 protein [Solirubrobacterales bacterium]
MLPLRWAAPGPIDELSAYLRGIAGEVDEILVVDGSPPEVFNAHAAALRGVARHLRPDPELDFRMGKVNGVVTGLRECSHERVVIADDDVRYEPAALRRTAALLGEADLVRPQNYFDELPWHACWDTARSLLNRVFSGDPEFPVGDFPGTLAVRRSVFLSSGAYDGDALFENLELMRTIRAAGGRVITPLDLYVARRPPTAAHFLSQRVRQAYDDFAMPGRLAAYLAIGPLALGQARRRRWPRLALAAASAVGVAELGRRRAGGAERFPFSGSLLAPAWIAERAACSWLAVGERLAGGVRYGDRRLPLAANSLRVLRRRYAESRASGFGSESDGPSSESASTDSTSGASEGDAAKPLSARNRVVL